MNEAALLPRLYWHTKEHPSWGLPDVQYTVLWLFLSGRFRYINCWPGYAWFSASGEWKEQDGRLLCQGKSRGFSDDLLGTHADRVYTKSYTLNEEGGQLGPGESYKVPLTRIRSTAVETLFRGLDEKDLPCHWRGFQELMGQIERHLGIKRTASNTFLKDRELA